MDKKIDTWISQAEFIRPNRRVVNLLRLGLLFADLDTYRVPALASRKPDELAASVLFLCADAGLPAPSILIYSGRGIQAKWLLEGTIPRQALPRWNACQRYLVDRLAYVGADPMAKDASRVLRTVETVNSKSGEVCRVVHVQSGNDGQPIRYNFEYLAEALLPAARWTIEQQRQEQAERRAKKKPFLLVPGGKADNLRGFSGRQLAWDRLEDLRKLAELRGGVGEGSRMQHLFWRLNFLLLSGATNSKQMYHEAAALARELDPQWNSRSKELMTLFSKAKAYEAGEKVTFGGKEFTPLYTPKNDTLINLFRITTEEQRQLKTIVSQAEAAERHRKREEARRRAAGAVGRETYEQASLTRQKPWEALGMSRRSWYRAGKPTA
ncbi:replication protein [Pseudomonas brassicacearum]|uniref:replication protein n=1 Tax=Pseudomonas brassicacearum TaxID=930166 RepID=UPI00215ED609|nr:replication protein [Pseudomonas brassicacearum]UVM45661.1 replication protein [Pseudomonas brassicacearum]